MNLEEIKRAIQCGNIETIERRINHARDNEKEALLEYAMQLYPEDDPVVITLKHAILFHAIDCGNLERVKRYLHWTHLKMNNHVVTNGASSPIMFAYMLLHNDHPILKIMRQYLYERSVTPFLVHLERNLSKHHLYDKNAFTQVIALSRPC